MQDTPATRRWRLLCDELTSSGMTVSAFAARKGVNPRTLAWWRSRLRSLEAREIAFTEVRVEPQPPPVLVRLDGLSAYVVVEADTDLVLVRRLLEALS